MSTTLFISLTLILSYYITYGLTEKYNFCKTRSAVGGLGIIAILNSAVLLLVDLPIALQVNVAHLIATDSTNILILYIYAITILLLLINMNDNHNYWWVDSELIIILITNALISSLLIQTEELITFYVILEIQSILTYIIISKGKTRKSLEATIKYFILSSISSFFLLTGFSFIYYMTGTTKFEDWLLFFQITLQTSNNMIKILASIFIISGLYFKLYIAPFHFWVPDIYASISYKVLMYLSSLPNIIFFYIFVKLSSVLHLHGHSYYLPIIIGIVLSATLGTIGALYQSNFKKLIAYSSIANGPFVLVVSTFVQYNGIQELMTYLFFYNMTTLALLIMANGLFETKNELIGTNLLTGLYKTELIIAILWALLLYGLAGLPPFGFFFAKIAIIKHSLMIHHFTLFLVLILTAIIAAFYYVQLIKNIFYSYKNKKNVFFQMRMTYLSLYFVLIIVILTTSYGIFPVLPSSMTFTIAQQFTN